jgi:hypothetical protein
VVKTGEVAEALSAIEAAPMVATTMAVATSGPRIMLHIPVPMLRILFAVAGDANRPERSNVGTKVLLWWA